MTPAPGRGRMAAQKVTPVKMQEANLETSSLATYFKRYWGYLALLIWGGALAGFGIVRFDPYGLEEGAARGLILIWAIGDRVLNPLITLGVPDFRALLFIPLGFYWAGSMLAAKVFTMLVAFLAVTFLYRWCERTADQETAVIACGLLLVFPLFINQVDAIAPGVYLLLAFGLGALLNERYRQSQRLLGGWFFIQMFWVAITITLHPAGLAYPAALAWHWRRVAIEDERRRKHLYIGLLLVVGTIVGVRGGWQVIEWFWDPFVTLSSVYQGILGVTGAPNAFVGTVFSLGALLIAWVDRGFLLRDPLGSMLLFGSLIGLLAADAAWALLVVTLVLLRGTWHLLRLNEAIGGGGGLLRHRALVLALFLVVSTTAMLADKTRAQAIREDQLSQQDRLIRLFAQDVEDMEDSSIINVASQWPGRTMIAGRVNTFQLPPTGDESHEEFLHSIGGITHLIFDPYRPENAGLTRRLAELTSVAKTAEISEAGVIIHMVPESPEVGLGED